jgi:hypothetical protein
MENVNYVNLEEEERFISDHLNFVDTLCNEIRGRHLNQQALMEFINSRLYTFDTRRYNVERTFISSRLLAAVGAIEYENEH